MRNSLLAAMALCGATMSTMPLWAATEWADPTLKTVAIDLESDGYYYIYHPATKLFMANGNAQNNWGTEVVLSDKGQRIQVKKATDDREAGTVTGWTLTMVDATGANNGGKPKYIWTNGTVLCMDYNLQVEGSFVWKITKNADSDTYRIRIPEEDPRYGQEAQDGLYANSYMAWDGQRDENGEMVNHTVWPLADNTTSGYEKSELDWAFVTVDEYKAYEAKFELKTALEYAVEKGYSDYSEYEALYTGSASAEEITAAAAELKQKVDDYLIDSASEENPVDLTNRISSPSFDNGTTGWTTERDTQSGQDNFSVQGAEKPTNGEDKFANFFERWVANPPQSDWSITQEVKDLPAGKYKLKADVLVNTDGVPHGAYVIADGGMGEERTAVDQSYINANPSAYTYEVDFTVLNSTATIGLRVIDADFQWLGVDNFKLIYYGKGYGSAREGLQTTLDEATAYLAQLEDEGTKCSVANKDKFSEDIKLAENAISNTEISEDSVLSLRMILINQMDALKKDAQAYSQLMPIVDDKLATLIDNYEPYAKLSDNPEAFVNIFDYTDGLEEAYNNGTFDPLQIDSVATKIDEAFRKDIIEMVNSGLTGDLYGMLQSPDFDNNSTTGWNGSPSMEAGVAEKYFGSAGAQSFDVYQELENIPNGVYTVSMRGFSRPGNNDELIAGWGDGTTNTVYAQLYGNEDAVTIHHLYDGGRTEPYATKDDGSTDDKQISVIENKYVVNNRTNAAIAFEAGEYQNEVRCVVFDGKLRFGVKMNAEAGLAGSWTTMDNFRVNYIGEAEASDYVPSIQTLYDQMNALYTPISSLEKMATADVIQQLGDLMTQANVFMHAPTTKEDAEKLISDMKDAVEYANTSVERTNALNTLVDEVYNQRGPAYEAELSGIDLGDVYNLCDEITAIIAYNEIESVDKVDEYTVQINSLLTKAVQDAACQGATKDDPKDLTALIVNPGFSLTDDETGVTTDTGDGWTTDRDGGDMNFRISAGEFYNNKSFDIHQTLYGLAPGFYRLSCNAFYRDGGYKVAAGKHRRGVEDLNAMLYAGPEDAWVYTPIMSIIEDGQAEPTASQNVNVADSLTTEDNPIEAWYIPNAMEDAGPAFAATEENENGLYYNELNFEVKEGQTAINIGIRKEQQTEDTDWTIFDTFKLFYYGSGEENRPTGVENIEEGTARILRTTYYTIDGAQIAKPTQRGLYIRKDELSDGTVKTGKILVK